MSFTKEVFSNGKLMLSGEYLVLDGADAFALPTQKGQMMSFTSNEKISDAWMSWKAYDHERNLWLDVVLDSIDELQSLKESNDIVKVKLADLILNINDQNDFFKADLSYRIINTLTFPRNWGLGSSSTLLANLSKITNVNPFELSDQTIGGSGYDIAMGLEGAPLVYKLAEINKANSCVYQALEWKPNFINQIFFVHLNQKQDTQEAVQHYLNSRSINSETISNVNEITRGFIEVERFETFEILIEEHEALLSEVLKIKTVKERLFSDFEGAMKSLGSWGGDFIMVAGEESYVRKYFSSKGYNTILNYSEIIADLPTDLLQE